MWRETALPMLRASETAGAAPSSGRVVSGMADVPRHDWSACRPGEAEGWAYLRACEIGTPPAFRLSAARVDDARGFAAGAPLFEVGYRLDTPLQGGWLGRACDGIERRFPGLLEWRLIGVGSPFSEECPLAVHPRLSEAERGAALGALITGIEREARQRGAAAIAFKDIGQSDFARVGPILQAAGYAPINSLPLAVLDLEDTRTLDAYLARLSSATRKDIRRKLKRKDAVSVEWRSDIEGLEAEIADLYASTRAQSHVHYGAFEELPQDYFARLSRQMPGQVAFACYRVAGVLAAFNLLFIETDRVIDKFLGMRYPLAREHDLYALSWVENVRFCQSIGRRYLQTGQTAYASKLRFGSALRPSTHMVKHRNPLLQGAVRLAAPLLSFPRWDPDLRAHRARKATA
ncbi:hypothetical protein GCM10007301_07480 [Azorhizobium oxalatiphilum]|uniref:BioF2-like acetyltransferase domain-containing protein n=1 Tax=Azorhizobium oxalatiphilum TaxID=980631 RepID=A0A917BLB0_9HYPH|nr:GNAT family N-acetyltransferase [Azorhizobium oxalatiphilum]GGF50607.1 hypothetical protein GCM10007301_07480 [Azorhizobium oxalatiphilum]